MPAPKPVIIDTDVAFDDWMAILYLLRHPEVAVKGITVTGTGEAHSLPGARNCLGLLALANQPDVPLAYGTETPLCGHHAFPDSIREMVDNVMGFSLPQNRYSPLQQSAVDLLTEFLLQSSEKATLLALGPLTNLAELFLANPSLVDRLEMIYIMGGAIDVPGNLFETAEENTFAEWNIYCDPYAAKVVFHSGAPITLVPLDATNQVPVTLDFYRRLEKDRHTPETDFLYQLMQKMLDFIPTGRMYHWDQLTAAILADESLATIEQRNLTVVDEEGPQSGRTLESNAGAPIRACTAADATRFETLFLDVLNGRLWSQA
jgi:inosine-uridine nucleoside N-ribohydrolase